MEEGEHLVDDFVPIQDEPYVPYFVENIHRNEEELEVEDIEFIDENAYDDDCLDVKEGIIENLEKQLAEIEERKCRADKRSEQRKKRLETEIVNAEWRRDVQVKEGMNW